MIATITKGTVTEELYATRDNGIFTGESQWGPSAKKIEWQPIVEGKQYSLPLILTPEDDGGYSVECPFLPGAVSQGDTIDETISNAQEAIRLLIETYLAENMMIPWRNDRIAKLENQELKWVIVDV